MQNIQNAIENVLNESDIKSNRISYIKQVFNTLQDNTKFAEIPLGHSKSITWYIEQLEMKIKPMMDYADNTVDALGIFYPTGTNVCVMVWEAHTPHDATQETFFGYCKEDGLVKRKKLGRIDALGKWEDIEKNGWSYIETGMLQMDYLPGIVLHMKMSGSVKHICRPIIQKLHRMIFKIRLMII